MDQSYKQLQMEDQTAAQQCTGITAQPSRDPKGGAAGQRSARGVWRSAIQQVQDVNRQQQGKGLSGDDRLASDAASMPSIIQEHQSSISASSHTAPRLAVMVHAALNIPGSKQNSSSSSSNDSNTTSSSSSSSYYVRAGVHKWHHPLAPQQQKTQPVRAVGGGAVWNGLLQLEPQGDLAELEVLLQLKCRGRLLGRPVLVGSASIPLSDVLADPQHWGSKQQVVLTGHKAGAAGTLLEVQLFLAASAVQTPLRVLCGTWNVGNALPPPPQELQEWLKGARESEHHLVAVAAQECNYIREMRRFVTQQRKSLPGQQVEAAAATPTAAAAAAAAAGSFGGASVSTAADEAPATQPSTAAKGVGEESLQLQDSVVTVVDGDALLTTQRLGSTRAALKSKLVDALDSAAMWERHVTSTLGDQYWLVGAKHMFQTRLLVFARADVVPSITHISSGFEATGIGRVGMNKGGVGVGLRVGSTHIAFVGSHLAAHQSKTQQRTKDVGEICHELDLSASSAAAGADLVTGFHHVVWMGDLNYRLEYGQHAATQADSPTPEDFTSLCEIIAQQRYEELLPLDQLRRERIEGRVFAGFAEGSIGFAPTFKVHKGEAGFSYASKRSPAWCDRVLFKSVLPHKQATCDSYFTVADICTSDHKPVAAVVCLPLATQTVAGSRSSQTLSTASSPRGIGSPAGSLPLTPTGSWGSAAAARLARLSRISRRSSTQQASSMLFRLYFSAVSVGDLATWDRLASLADKSLRKAKGKAVEGGADGPSDAALQQTPSSNTLLTSSSGMKADVTRSSSDVSNSQKKRRLRLNLVVSGACMAHGMQQHVRLNQDTVHAARSAQEQPSLLLRDDSIQLLPGPLSQLTDDWLLVRLVLADGWKREQTLARGILPLQPAVAAYRSSVHSVPVTLQLESSSAAVGSLVCKVQLISSASIRAGMYEAIRRMRTMAAATRSASLDSGGY